MQIVGDAAGVVVALGDRDCSVQRRHQKLVEIAPAPDLPAGVRDALAQAAATLARAVGYRGLGTVEFLVSRRGDPAFVFLEVNPRLQVEHTVTEEVLGIDLVALGIRLVQGATLAELGLEPGSLPVARGIAIQARVNAEVMQPDGTVTPSAGTLVAFQPPTGPGVRTDTAAYTGYTMSPRFDSLLAKVVVHTRDGDLAAAAARAHRAVTELRIEGVATNRPFLQAVLAHSAFTSGAVATTFVEEHATALAGAIATDAPFPPIAATTATQNRPGTANGAAALPAGAHGVVAPQHGSVVSVLVAEGDAVGAGTTLLVLEAMKMEHEIVAPASGIVVGIAVGVGDVVAAEHVLVVLEPGDHHGADADGEGAVDPGHVRADLQEVFDRQALTRDEARPDAVAKRRGRGRRTARENLADLVDDGSFVEYGALVVAAQRGRRTEDELIAMTPADGVVAGIGRVNGDLFGDAGRAAVFSYDYTVFAGTQGLANHRKKDRLFDLVESLRLPVIFFAEGGGGRPGDVDAQGPSQLPTRAFALWGGLSGLVPRIAVVSGRCFAGNAAIAGCG